MREKKVVYPGLSAAIGERGDTYETLAKSLNMSISAVARRMSGEVEWSIGEVKQLCAHYDKSFYELFD